jgi:nucleotide-binding universal stress UspA family protein
MERVVFGARGREDVMYTRILVAVGNSSWSDAAMAYASALAARTGAALRIVSVLTTPTASATPDMASCSIRELADIEHRGQVIATRAAAQATSVGATYEVNCIWGSVPEIILNQAADCDLIVLGSRGVLGWKRLFAGRIINAVAAKATQPVAVVKTSATPPAPLGHRVLVAVGSSPWSREALRHALQLAQAQGLELCVLHVDHMWLRREEYPIHSDGKNLLTWAEARAAMSGVAYEGILASGPVLDAILDTATYKSCDTIVMGSRGIVGWKRLVLGDIANSVIAKAPQPVFIIKHFFDPEDPRRRRVRL